MDEMSRMIITDPLIRMDVAAENAEAVLSDVCRIAETAGFVDGCFMRNLLAREQRYPTGLPTAVPIAIPHIQEGCRRSFFSISILREPVEFGSMGGGPPVRTRLVFVFGIVNPAQQTRVLKQFSVLFQDETALNRLLVSETASSIVEQLKTVFGPYISHES